MILSCVKLNMELNENDGIPHIFAGKYEIFRKIGRTKKSSVYLTYYQKNSSMREKAVIKISSREYGSKLFSEYNIGTSIDSEYVCRFYEFVEDKNFVGIVMSYIPGGELNHYIGEIGEAYNDYKLTDRKMEYLCAFVIFQVALGIGEFHHHHILHGDIKPDNILIRNCSDINQPKEISIIDFGCSIHLEEGETIKSDTVGTPMYNSPEMARGEAFGYKSDIWSLGVVAYLLLAGRFPCDLNGETSEEEMIQNIRNYRISFENENLEYVSSDCKSFLMDLLAEDPDKRPDIDEVLVHPFFANLGINQSSLEIGSTKFGLGSFYEMPDDSDSVPVL